MRYIQSDGLEVVVARLRAQGYDRVATEVESRTMKQPRIIIEVRKGLVEEVYSDTPVEVSILDHDAIIDFDEKQLRRFRSLEKAAKTLQRQPFL